MSRFVVFKENRFKLSVMKYLAFIVVLLFVVLESCGQQARDNTSKKLIDPEGLIIETRILTPGGFERVETDENSFADYLHKLPLKPDGANVKLYNGDTKANKDIYDAVVDLKIGNKNLHQCADAVMRLRAEYLYQQKQYDKIHFNFTSGFVAEYSKWRSGYKIVLDGNDAEWRQSSRLLNTYDDFWEYLEMVFTYAGTLSLSKEMKTIEVENMQAGDVFIQGGSPGHAVIVVDMAIDTATKKKVFLLAQSYMPAQEIQIVKNPNDKAISPWYSVDFGNTLHTPEWTFTKNDLKRFKME